jgi:hypothetical protein
MWDGYLTLGGNEIGNNARALGYQRTSNCPVTWIRDIDCTGLLDALDEQYTYDRIDEAPWFDPDDPDTTGRFLGLYVVSMEGVSDSTRSAVITEKITDGAQVSGYRHAAREVRIRALLTARGMDALEGGMTWLRSALEPDACGVHGGDCGASDMQFFVDCPPARGTVPAYSAWTPVRENLFANPRGTTTSSTYWGTPAGGAYSLRTDMIGDIPTAVRWTSSGTSTGAIRHQVGTSMPSAGAPVHYRVRVFSNDTVTIRALARPTISSSAGQAQLGPEVVIGPGLHDLEFSGSSFADPAGAASGVTLLTVGTFPAGLILDVTGVLIESGLGPGDYFDGSKIGTELTQYTWTGAENLSTSIESTRVVEDLVPEPDVDYFPRVDRFKRFLHSVRCISGPLIQAEYRANDNVHFGYLVEFTLLAAVPFVYGASKAIPLSPTVPTVIQDVAYNLVETPSATPTSGTQLVATNLSTNPSVETNDTGWAFAAGSPITTGMLTGGRVTGELAAVGTASYRVVFTATNTSTAGWFAAEQQVAIPATTGARYSINIWGAAVTMVGTPTITDLQVFAIWRNGTTVLRTDTLGTVPAAGGAHSAASILPPATTNNVIVRVRANVASWASGNVIRLYADALAVTNP